MAAIYYLKDNRQTLEDYKGKLPDNLFLPMNMGRFSPRSNLPKGKYYTERPNDAVNLRDWLQYQFDTNKLIVQTNDIVTSIAYTIDAVTYPAGTAIETILTAIINSAIASAALPHYTFTQASPATVWTISHPLLTFPSVTTVNNSDEVIEGDVVYVDSSNITVTFTTALSGKVYLN